MQLIYTDESGINYKHHDEGLFNDGPFILYGAICVDDRKYFHLERLFLEIINDYFNIDDWIEHEVHGSDLWNLKGIFQNESKEKIRGFFDEVLQLITKLNISTLICLGIKTKNSDKALQKIEFSYVIYSFLHLIEMHLAECNDTGIIISDKQSITSNDGNVLLSDILYSKSLWRTNPKATTKPNVIQSKYKYESRACFILDNIHYIDSKHSLFNQIIDIILYSMMRVFTYKYIKITDTKNAEINKVPVTAMTFCHFFKNATKLSYYDIQEKDICFYDQNSLISNRDFFGDNAFRNFINWLFPVSWDLYSIQ